MRRICYRAAIAAAMLSLGVFTAGAIADDLTYDELAPDTASSAPDQAKPEGLGPGCEDGYSCMWDYHDFFAWERKWRAGNNYGYHHLQGGPARSAKNRFGNRKLQLVRGDPTTNDDEVIACLDPGEGRPDPGAFGWVFVGVAGSRCNN